MATIEMIKSFWFFIRLLVCLTKFTDVVSGAKGHTLERLSWVGASG